MSEGNETSVTPIHRQGDQVIPGDLSVGGDVAVSHNADVGGRLGVRGHATVDHNMVVKGWLRAKNIICHFRGFYLHLVDAPTDGRSGDYIFVRDEEPSEAVSVWVWDVTTETWVDSGIDTTMPTEIDIDESDVGLMAHFYTGQVVGETSIVDNLTTNSADDVLSAKQGKRIWDRLVPLVPEFTVNVSNPQEYTGSDKQVILGWSSKRDGALRLPTEVKIYKDSDLIERIVQPESATGLKVSAFNKLDSSALIGDTVFSIEITADGMTKTASQTVRQVLPCYIGFYSYSSSGIAEHADTIKNSLEKKVLSGVSGLSGTYNNLTSGDYLTILVPNNLTITKVTSSGFDVPMQHPMSDSSITVGGVARTYKIYRTASGINPGNMTIVVS